MHVWNPADMVSNLSSTDVLPLPPEGITNAVLELHPPRRLTDDEVSRTLEKISLLEHVADELLLRRFFVVEILDEKATVGNSANGLTFLTQGSRHAESRLGVTVGHLRVRIILDNQGIVLEEPPERASEPNLASSHDPLAVVVELGDSLRGPIELADLRHAKALTERFPDFATQAVARSYDTGVVSVVRGGLAGEQIAAQFTDIQDACGPRVVHVFPELRC